MKFKKFLKYFVFIFLINFLIFNWNEVSWIFNYKVVSGIISNFFQKNNPVSLFNSFKEETKLKKFEYSDKENSLEIPRIGIEVPLFLVESKDENKILEALDRGAVLFSDSALPGQPGQTIIVGHSARHDWPKTVPAWAFTYLRDVVEGDEVILHFNHQKLNYYVTEKTFLNRGEEIAQAGLTNSENMLVLISCWPPGKDLKRIALKAVLR